MNVPVLVPALPECWADAQGWELRWVARGLSGGPVMLAPETTIALDLPRGWEASLMCSAVYGDERSMPYGAPWPQWLSDDGLLRLDPEGGLAASLVAPLYRAGSPSCSLDLRRFTREAVSRLDDPWNLDFFLLSNVVAERRFRLDYLRLHPMVSVVLQNLPCAMISDSPWGSAIEPDIDGMAIVSIAPGRVRRWFGSGYTLALLASQTGSCSWTLSGP